MPAKPPPLACGLAAAALGTSAGEGTAAGTGWRTNSGVAVGLLAVPGSDRHGVLLPPGAGEAPSSAPGLPKVGWPGGEEAAQAAAPTAPPAAQAAAGGVGVGEGWRVPPGVPARGFHIQAGEAVGRCPGVGLLAGVTNVEVKGELRGEKAGPDAGPPAAAGLVWGRPAPAAPAAAAAAGVPNSAAMAAGLNPAPLRSSSAAALAAGLGAAGAVGLPAAGEPSPLLAAGDAGNTPDGVTAGAAVAAASWHCSGEVERPAEGEATWGLLPGLQQGQILGWCRYKG